MKVIQMHCTNLLACLTLSMLLQGCMREQQEFVEEPLPATTLWLDITKESLDRNRLHWKQTRKPYGLLYYQIQRRIDSGNWETIASPVNPDAGGLVDEGWLQPNSIYQYRLREITRNSPPGSWVNFSTVRTPREYEFEYLSAIRLPNRRKIFQLKVQKNTPTGTVTQRVRVEKGQFISWKPEPGESGNKKSSGLVSEKLPYILKDFRFETRNVYVQRKKSDPNGKILFIPSKETREIPISVLVIIDQKWDEILTFERSK